MYWIGWCSRINTYNMQTMGKWSVSHLISSNKPEAKKFGICCFLRLSPYIYTLRDFGEIPWRNFNPLFFRLYGQPICLIWVCFPYPDPYWWCNTKSSIPTQYYPRCGHFFVSVWTFLHRVFKWVAFIHSHHFVGH